MRTQVSEKDFSIHTISGTHVVLLAIDATRKARKGLLGFALKRTDPVENQSYWLKGIKVFKEVVPQPQPGRKYSSLEQPIQSFLWGDYTAKPGRTYDFILRPVYGSPKNLTYGDDITFSVETEESVGKTHDVYFNRGAIASQAFADQFDSKGPASPDDPTDKTTVWLSRGLLEAALAFIDETLPGEVLRVAAYEFTYKPILLALANAHKRGVDVTVVYEAGQETVKGARVDTDITKGNKKAIDAAVKAFGFPKAVLRKRTNRNDIPHNKFIVRTSEKKDRIAVWTGSTNFSPSGFLGQTNVGHIIRDTALADQFLAYWAKLEADEAWDPLRDWNETNTPNPVEPLTSGHMVPLFSPRRNDSLLKWYAAQIDSAKETVMFTAAFGVNGTFTNSFAKDAPFLRYILLEKPLDKEDKAKLTTDRDVQIANGAALGKLTLKAKVPGWQLDKWYLEESHYRTQGNIFYIHTKILLIDPFGDNPLVISGSANFSKNSLVNNDENMTVIAGDTRVADIYLTEFDRIFRHFYFRNVANAVALKNAGKANTGEEDAEAIFLDPTDKWTEENFDPMRMKSKRRRLFFPKSKN